jgi:arginase
VSVELIVVPYVLGREGVGMGAGPLALEHDAIAGLQPDQIVRISLGAPFANEIGACFDLNRQVARAVAGARERGALPVVLTGNCHTQQAVVAGTGVDRLALVWLDCHADFHTPETTPTGFFDGMALAMTVGDCWRELCASVPGFSPMPAARVVLGGARDVEPGERRRLDASGIVALGANDVAALATAVPSVERVSLHVDLDVLDPARARANEHAVAPGLEPEELVATVRAIVARGPLAAVTLSAYDPAFDATGSVHRTAIAVLRTITGEIHAPA